MRTSITRATVSAALGLALVAGTAATSSAMPLREPGGTWSATPTVQPAAQKYYWDWSDGSDAVKRTFSWTKYGSQKKLPHLLAWAEPSSPRQWVYLKFKQNGKWVLETKKKTNSKGEATLDLNPYCDNNTWCDGTWTYRLSIGDVYQNFKITYTEN